MIASSSDTAVGKRLPASMAQRLISTDAPACGGALISRRSLISDAQAHDGVGGRRDSSCCRSACRVGDDCGHGSTLDIIGAAGAALTTLCWLPQAMKVMREKETRALSLPATAAFTAGIALWLIYGMAIDDWPLIGSNAATLALMAPILAMKLRYG